MYSCQIVDTLTGVKLQELQPASGTWKTLVNSIGSGQHSFLLRDAETPLPAATWRDLTTPWGRTLVVSWTSWFGQVSAVYAGLIDSRSWEKTSGTLTVSHQEMRALLRKRLSSDLPRFWPYSSFTISGRSLPSAALAVCVYGLLDQPGSIWTLPVVFSTPNEAGPYSFEWPHTKFDTVDAMLRQITDTDGGPDVWFQPAWSSSGRLEWWVQIGSPRLPGSTFEWNMGADVHPVSDFNEAEDGSQMLTGVFGLGEGSEADMLLSKAGSLPGPVVPAMDSTRPHKEIDDQARLDGLTMGDLRLARWPSKGQTFALQLDDGSLGPVARLGDTLRVGARLRVFDPGDEFMAEGWRGGYLVGLSGDVKSLKVGVEVQPL